MTRAHARPSHSRPDFLQLCNLAKTYGQHTAVNPLNLSIGQGEIFALLGSSGCGKTTLLRMLAGFEAPTSGRIILNGQDLAELPPYARPLNMMFQSYALFPHLTVWDNIAFGLRRDGLPASQIQAQVEAMLKLVQLSAYAKRKPHQLSGGQQQRVALARSLAKKPQLLLLDEPLGALDKKLREQTQIELLNILHEVGVTCVMVTHDQEEAMTMATRIGVMSEGRLLQVGPPREVYETPQSRFVADFIGNVNLLEGRLTLSETDHAVIESSDCKHYLAQPVTGTPGTPLTVALRPEKIRLSMALEPPNDLDGAPSGHNCVQGTLTERAYCGSFTVYRLALASGQTLKISISNTDRQQANVMQPGERVWAQWSPTAPMVLSS